MAALGVEFIKSVAALFFASYLLQNKEEKVSGRLELNIQVKRMSHED
jgi:hypothetical protein